MLGRATTVFALCSLLVLSACEGNRVASADADQYASLAEHEQRTLEQAQNLQETLNRTTEKHLSSLR